MPTRKTRPPTRRDPATRQRSPWIQQPQDPAIAALVASEGHGAWVPAMWTRNVSDGVLMALVGEEPEGWHLSISHGRGGRPGRYPTWDEQADAREMLLPADVAFVMHLPAESSPCVATHPTTFHWHEHPARSEVEAARWSDDNDLLVATALIKELHNAIRSAISLIEDDDMLRTQVASYLARHHLPDPEPETHALLDVSAR